MPTVIKFGSLTLLKTQGLSRSVQGLLYLYSFIFSVRHTRGICSVVADALSRIFEGKCLDTPGTGCVAFMQSLILFYFSLKYHQKKNLFCLGLRDTIQTEQSGADNVQLSEGL